MTFYETMTLIVSGVAIIVSVAIPIAGHIYKKLRRPQLDIYEFEHQPLTIMYSPSGNQIRINFSIACNNSPCVIRSIKSTVISKANGNTLEMRWSFTEPINLNWANGTSGTIGLNTLTRAHPLLIDADSLLPLSARFEPLNNDELLDTYNNALSLFNTEAIGNPGKQCLCDHPESTVAKKELRIIEQELEERCFWVPGSYELNIELLYDANRSFMKSYRFDLNNEEARLLKCNSKKMMTCAECHRLKFCTKTPQYAFVSKDVKATK